MSSGLRAIAVSSWARAAAISRLASVLFPFVSAVSAFPSAREPAVAACSDRNGCHWDQPMISASAIAAAEVGERLKDIAVRVVRERRPRHEPLIGDRVCPGVGTDGGTRVEHVERIGPVERLHAAG